MQPALPAALAHSRRRASLPAASDDRARVAMNRRSGSRGGMRRGGGGGGVGPATTAIGIEGYLAATNYYQSAADTVVAGAIGGFGVSMAIYVKSAPPALTSLLYVSGLTGSSGAALYYINGSGLVWAVYSTAGAQVLSPASAVVAGDVGQIVLVSGIHDGSNLRLYRAGAESGSGTAITGYKAPLATSRISIGSTVVGANPTPWARVVGVSCYTGAAGLADVQAWEAATRFAGTVVPMGGAGVTNTHRWRGMDNSPAAASWVDVVSSVALARTGTLSAVSFSPVWD